MDFSTPHIMLDLETLGTKNDSVIISIGAVRFTDTEILGEFHVGIEPASATALGLKIDGDTVKWWLDDDRQPARTAWMALEKVDLGSAVAGFAYWATEKGSKPTIWGNGSTFDNAMLRHSCEAVGIDYPTPFYKDACYRTIKNMAPFITLDRVGVHHDAVDDARSQAVHLQKILAHFKAVEGSKHLIQIGATQFRFYEANYRAKDEVDATAKAEVNRILAEQFEAGL